MLTLHRLCKTGNHVLFALPTILPQPMHHTSSTHHTAPGPGGLPYWLCKDFAQLSAPVITKICNLSIEQQCVWKLANVTPLPKESPLTECNQLRPISLTNIMRLFERVANKRTGDCVGIQISVRARSICL